MKTRIIIIAAGEGSRWANYTGVPKHLVDINGLPLLQDTVNKAISITDDILIACNEMYNIQGAKSVKADLQPSRRDADKFLSSVQYWEEEARNIILYGDVYFSDYLISVIKLNITDFVFYGRAGASKHTLKNWGELFAISFTKKDFWTMIKYLENLERIAINTEQQRIAGWELYRMFTGEDINEHRINGNFINVDDFSEDFDYPIDYDNWKKQYNLKPYII
jgi:hypothetical protein